MAALSITFQFTSGTTIQAGQFNTNFQDIVDATSDGTTDFTVGALSAAGTVNFTGSSITFGNASGDDVSILGSLAATLNIKTNTTYNIGSSTLGLAGLFLGGTSTFTTKLATSATASYTVTTPPTAGSAGDFLFNTGSATLAWAQNRASVNLGLTASVAANALTIAIKTNAGTDATSTNPASVTFRHATLTTGTTVTRAVTAATSLVISSGSTLGHRSGIADNIFVYAIDNAGTVELAASSFKLDEGAVYSTTAEGGAGAADSRSVLYSTTARTDVAVKLIGRLASTQGTAGTWATAISEISLGDIFPEVAQLVYSHGVTYASGNAPTISAIGGTISSVTGSYFMPYQVQGGAWRLKFNFQVVMTANLTTIAYSVNDLSFGISGYRQPITLVQRAGTATAVNGYAEPLDSTFQLVSAASTDTWSLWGDILLTAKPNWVY